VPTVPGAASMATHAAGPDRVKLGQLRARGRLLATAGLLGPAFVASVAYVDPGNFATNFAAGAGYGYELAWVIVMANLMAILVQYLTSKAGLATGRSLPELCRERYGRWANVMLWLQAEVIAMATDLAEFVGAAVGINLIFGVPLLAAGLITAVVAFVILGLQQRGHRRFELAIIALLALVGLGFLYLFFAAGGQDYPRLAVGLLPRLSGGAPSAWRSESSARPSCRMWCTCTRRCRKAGSARPARVSAAPCWSTTSGTASPASASPGWSTCPCCASPPPCSTSPG
jgi:uncharacterized membrane protein